MSVNDTNKKAAINMISLFLAVQLVSAVIPLFLPEDTGIVGFLLPSMVLFSLGAIGMIVIERRQQMKFEFEERFSNNTASVLLWGLIGMFIAIVVQTFASIIEVNFLGSSMESENTQFLMEVVRNYPLFLLLVGIAGPVMEEFVFRKAMFGLMIDQTRFLVFRCFR